MSFEYASFLRRTGEGLLQFDNRVSHMLPVVAGTVFFDMQNYIRESGEFRVYIRWNAELSGMLQDRLPSGGYFVKATAEQAKLFHEQTDGLPVYMKLIAKEGRLYPYRTYVMWNGRPFSVEFNGNYLIPVDYQAKAKGRELPEKQAERRELTGSQCDSFGSGYQLLLGSGGLYEWFRSSQRQAYGGSQSVLYGQAGSRRFLYGQTGSQGALFGISGSQSFWQLYLRWLSGSWRGFSGGSARGVFLWKSYLWGGSNRAFLSGNRYVFGGSNRRFFLGSGFGYAAGSQRFSYGSNRGFLFGSGFSTLLGSGGLYEWFRSSQRRMYGGSERGFFIGSRSLSPADICQPSPGGADNEPPYWRYLPLEWQLINRAKRPCSKKGENGMFGYGLDLIDE